MNSLNLLLIIALILFFSQFIYSGINKINNFPKKVDVLGNKTKFNKGINEFGMVCVILLEIIGSLVVLGYFIFNSNNTLYRNITIFTLIIFCLFLVVVTVLYHPPGAKMIPFMSNISILGAFLLLIYITLNKQV